MVRKKKPFYKKWWVDSLFFFMMLMTGFIGTFILLALNTNFTTKKINSNTIVNFPVVDSQTLKIIEGDNNFSIGSENPKVTIVEFSDYACLVCKDSFSKIREIGIKYKDDVKIIFRDYPLISENSVIYAEAVRCAGEQNKFLEMHDKLFLNQENLSKDLILKLAQNINLDMTKYINCLQSERHRSNIMKDITDGQFLKLRGTPTLFINGQKLEGDIPMEVLEKIINSLINKNNN